MHKNWKILSWIIWAIFAIPVPIYAVVVLYHGSREVSRSESSLATILLGVSLGTAVFTFLIRWVYGWGMRRIPDLEKRSAAFFAFLPIVGFVVWCLSISISTCGLLLFFTTGQMLYFLPFVLLTSILLILHAPPFWGRKFQNYGPNKTAHSTRYPSRIES
jgi:hypothetical protein